MSREIKFRLWCRNKKEWEKDPWVISPSGNIYDVKHHSILNKENHILSQFTGIHDKNGKEVFEDDIARVKKPRGITIDYGFFEIIGQVFYHNGSYYIGGQDVFLSSMKPTDIEVIGNIYDNPELLEGVTS